MESVLANFVTLELTSLTKVRNLVFLVLRTTERPLLELYVKVNALVSRNNYCISFITPTEVIHT